ncbi:hypothetical protein [Pseudonocardia phyllosphaerae]|uniref:hypothetical protein n=1 Tax=Pseudonocardia phyllosphaerae TaxID=3390502 RepID=UPI00397E7CD3
MVRVEGHWRNRSWVRTHYRHPLRPEGRQTGLLFPRALVVRIAVAGGPYPSSPVTARPPLPVPGPRRPHQRGRDR